MGSPDHIQVQVRNISLLIIGFGAEKTRLTGTHPNKGVHGLGRHGPTSLSQALALKLGLINIWARLELNGRKSPDQSGLNIFYS